jgi:chromosome segregation ATPase
MNDEELIARLRSGVQDEYYSFGDDPAITETEDIMRDAADRIEQLNAKLAEAKDEITECHKEAMSWVERWGAALKGQRESDANLAKAVEALEHLVTFNDDYILFVSALPQDRVERTWRDARTTLAELKGESQDGMV